MILNQLRELLESRASEIDRRTGEAQALAKRGKELKAEIAELEEYRTAAEEAVEVLSSFADQRQEELQRQVEGLVTEGLRTVFGDQDLEFRMVATRRGKLANVDLLVRSRDANGDWLETSVMDARGGGVAAVAGFMLRLVVLLLKPGARKLLVLDEVFAQLSAEYEPRMAEFLKELVERTDAQVLLVTHSDTYAEYADRVYRFSNVGGSTKVADDT